jgi:hypothetical protein
MEGTGERNAIIEGKNNSVTEFGTVFYLQKFEFPITCCRGESGNQDFSAYIAETGQRFSPIIVID